MNSIRIAHILPFSNIGGTEQATLRLAEAAAQCGFENILYCPKDADDLRRFYHRSCFTTGCYEQVEPSYHHPLPYLRAAKHLAHDLRRHRVNIVHCADILGAHYTALAGRLAGAFVISHVRCQHAEITRRDRTFLFPVQRWVFVSRETWNTFGMKVPPSDGEVLYDGLTEFASGWSRLEARAHYGLCVETPVVGMASRVHPGKDFETLIRAARHVIDVVPQCRFLIAGDYQQNPGHREHYQRLQPLLRETRTADHFMFAGFEPEMPRFYAAIDVLALSSHAEGFPLSVLEAMAHGKPVVATQIGGIPELVTNEKTGLLTPPQSPDAFAAALLKLLCNPGEAEWLAQAGREHVRSNFSGAQYHDRVRELYCGIAKQRGLLDECAPCIQT